MRLDLSGMPKYSRNEGYVWLQGCLVLFSPIELDPEVYMGGSFL